MAVEEGGSAALEHLSVEHVERDDGRYLLYYTWPWAAEDDDEPAADPPPAETDV